MIGYELKNVNPKKKKTGDCVIRAIAWASGIPYNEVYRELFEISLKTGYMINDKKTYERLLEKYGFVKRQQPRKFDNSKYTIGEIDKLISSKDVAVVSCANHLTCVLDNEVVDIWDCRHKSIGNYYLKEV